MSRNLRTLSARQGLGNSLFKRLVQTGAREETALKALADEYLVGEAAVLGASSFYDFLSRERVHKKVSICSGTGCLVARTQQKLRAQLEKHFDPEEIGEACCLGRCHENAAFEIEGTLYSGDAAQDVDDIVRTGKAPTPAPIPTGSNLDEPILTAEFPGVDVYYGVLEELLEKNPGELLDELKASALRGRGGAGFPTGLKWEFCRNAKAETKYVVCNADEGDPGAYTDRFLLEERPHLVFLGMILCGYVIGAAEGVLYVRAEYPGLAKALEETLAALEKTPYLGDNICGGSFSFRLHVVEGAGAYVCGEETALLASLEGRRPEVAARPPFPAEEGLFGKPTVVNNVETFALVPAVMTRGAEAFCAVGTERSTGPKLVSLDGRFERPGVYEIAMGTPLETVFQDFGGGFREPVKAVQVGGPLGGIVPALMFGSLTLDFESLEANGFLLGHGSMIGIPESFPIAEFIEHLFDFTAKESCGKCVPCRLGSVRGREMFAAARAGERLIDPDLLGELLETLEETSLCALGGGVPLPVRNALEYFAEELEPFMEGGNDRD